MSPFWKSAGNYLTHALGIGLLMVSCIALDSIMSPNASADGLRDTLELLFVFIAWIPLAIFSKRWFERHHWSSIYGLGNSFLFLCFTIGIDRYQVMFLGYWYKSFFPFLTLLVLLSLLAEWRFKKIPRSVWFSLRFFLILIWILSNSIIA